jgi:hypothetical protein
MSEIISKIKGDPKLIAIILVGVFLIGFLAYKLLGEFENNELTISEKNVGVNDVLIPKDEKIYNDSKKIETYADYRNKNHNKNIDYNTEDLFVFSENSELSKEDEMEQQIKNRTQSLKEKYRTVTSQDVKDDFYRNNQPNVNNAWSKTNSKSTETIPTNISSTSFEAEETKRRKGITDSGGNMTMNKKKETAQSYTLKAYVFNRSRIVKNGSTIRVMIDEPIKINSIIIPKNTILSGKAEFRQERIFVRIRSIQFENQIYNVQLIAYAIDGQVGIFSENLISHEIAQKSISGAIEQGETKVIIPLLGEVSVDFAKAKIQDQSVVVPDGTILILKSK